MVIVSVWKQNKVVYCNNLSLLMCPLTMLSWGFCDQIEKNALIIRGNFPNCVSQEITEEGGMFDNSYFDNSFQFSSTHFCTLFYWLKIAISNIIYCLILFNYWFG
jgi:hypothetical protein